MTSAKERPGQTEEERAYYSHERRVYRVFAYAYDAVVFPFRRLRHEVVSLVGLRPDARLLDVATGTGAQAFAFTGKAREVVGIDMSEAMLGIARRKNRFSNVTFQEANAADLPFDDRSFDVTCVSFALHEMPGSVRERVLREMARVTRPGGAVVIVDYGLPPAGLSRWLGYHLIKLYERESYATFVKSDLGALLEAAGMEVAERRPALRGMAQIVVARRAEAWARGRLTP